MICSKLTAGQTGLLFSEFQEKLQELELPGVSEKISVCVGVCTALPECELTDRELVRFASKAKQVAKERGKHRVVGYTGPTYDQEPVDLSVPYALINIQPARDITLANAFCAAHRPSRRS